MMNVQTIFGVLASLILASGCSSTGPKHYAAPSTAKLQTRIAETASAVQSARQKSERVESALARAEQTADKVFALAPEDLKPVVDGLRLELKVAKQESLGLRADLDKALANGNRTALEVANLQTEVEAQTAVLNATENQLAVARVENTKLRSALRSYRFAALTLLFGILVYFFGPQLLNLARRLALPI